MSKQLLICLVCVGILTSVACPRATSQEKIPPPSGAKYAPKLLGLLKKGKESERRKAALILGEGTIEDIMPALTEALGDEDEVVRALAAQGLGRLGASAKPAAPALRKVLADKSSIVRMEASLALGWIGPGAKDAVPALSDTLKDSDEDVRGVAAWALGSIGADAKAAVPTLLEALKDGSGVVRTDAAEALWRIEQRDGGLQVLLAGLKDGDEFVRALSAGALARNAASFAPPASQRVVAALTKTLADENEKTRAAAAFGLGQFGAQAREAFPALLAIYQKGQLERPFVADVLRQIDPAAAAQAGVK